MTTHTTPIDLRPFHGRECEATIGEHILSTEKGKISVSKIGSVFFFNNNRGGSINSEEIENFGYSREWIVQSYHESKWDDTQLKSITLLDEPKSINPEWDWKDGEIINNKLVDPGVTFEARIIRDLFFAISNQDKEVSPAYTFEGAFNSGYRKLPPPPSRKLVEITEEVFDKTNLIGRKVENSGGEEIVIKAISNEDGKRFVSPNKVQWFSISFCKLIEE